MYWGTSRWSAMEIMVRGHLPLFMNKIPVAEMVTGNHWCFVVSTFLAPGGLLSGTPVQPDPTCV